MKFRWSMLIAFFVMTAFGVAHIDAKTPVRDVAFYKTHPADRNATLKWCTKDARNADSYDCANAFRASIDITSVR